MTQGKWKDRLLSSSVPLEYEVAKILTKEKFFIDYDFTYQRLDEKEEKEFSIDVRGNGYYPFDNPDKIDIVIDILIECKYRNPDVKWAFLPDIKVDDDIGYSSRGALKFMDDFSKIRFKNAWNTLKIPISTKKGIEINTQNGEVHDTGIYHGINQLVYSLPVILAREIENNLESHIDDVYPYAFCAILVTTAELRILHEDFSIDSVKNAATLESISTEVPYLCFNTDLYPSFVKHCKNVFKNIPEKDQDNFDYFNELRAIKIDSIDGVKNEDPNIKFYQTENLMNSLKHGNGFGFFNDIAICSLKNLPDLIFMIKDAINTVGLNIEVIENKL